MEASLLNLILYIAALVLAHIVKNLTQHPLQRVVADLTARHPLGIFHGPIAVVANIERGAIEMTRVLRCIAIMRAQLSHIRLAAQYGRNNNLM